jgi:ketosteroid isomerase-like protein
VSHYNRGMRTIVCCLALLLSACATLPAADSTKAIDAVLDDFHQAAAQADEPRYFGHTSPDFVFLGTDSGERWNRDEFRAYAHPHFAQGKGWTFTPHDRHVVASGDTAWFDEKLDSASYGDCRGSGALRRMHGEWKVAQYNLTIPIPNDLAKEIVERIRAKR